MDNPKSDSIAKQQDAVTRLHAALGYRRLSRFWAKAEILIGLFAASAGMLLGESAVCTNRAGLDWKPLAASMALLVLGGYLALAGQRSHLYQSNNELAAYLADEMRRAGRRADPIA